MAEVFINTGVDMKWLRDVHLPGLAKVFKSALMRGNEDSPDEIEVYASNHPSVDDPKVVFKPNESGLYRPVVCRACGGSGRRSTARSAGGRELERHEKRGTPCDACGGLCLEV